MSATRRRLRARIKEAETKIAELVRVKRETRRPIEANTLTTVRLLWQWR